MKLTIKQSVLSRLLAAVTPAAEAKGTIPILSFVRIENSGQQLRISATDLETFVVVESDQFESLKNGTGEICLPAKKLLTYVASLPDQELTISTTENNWATLKCAKSQTRIAGMGVDSFPEIPEAANWVGNIPSQVLVSALKRSLISISLEESRFTMSGALFKPTEDGTAASIVSTDSHRLTVCSIAHALPEPMIVPIGLIKHLVRLTPADDGEIECGVSESMLFYKMPGIVVMGRRMSGNFPNFERVLPKNLPFDITFNRAELMASIKRTIQFSDDASHAMQFAFTPGITTLSSKLSDVGESTEDIECVGSQAQANIGFNGKYILDFLTTSVDETVKMSLKDGATAGMLVDSQAQYVIMPMRL